MKNQHSKVIDMTVFFFNYSKKKTNFLFAGCETVGGGGSFLFLVGREAGVEMDLKMVKKNTHKNSIK